MSIQDEARQESERRWPGEDETNSDVVAGFVQGYAAGANRASSVLVNVQAASREGGRHSTLADLIVERANARGIRVEFVEPDRESSEQEVEAAAHAMAAWKKRRTGAPAMIDFDMARAALLAAQEVRDD